MQLIQTSFIISISAPLYKRKLLSLLIFISTQFNFNISEHTLNKKHSNRKPHSKIRQVSEWVSVNENIPIDKADDKSNLYKTLMSQIHQNSVTDLEQPFELASITLRRMIIQIFRT